MEASTTYAADRRLAEWGLSTAGLRLGWEAGCLAPEARPADLPAGEEKAPKLWENAGGCSCKANEPREELVPIIEKRFLFIEKRFL